MKPVFSFPFVFILLVVSAAGPVRGQEVLDTSGNPVEAGVQYYIIPAKSGNGGGLVPSSRTFNPQQLCPLDVVQSPLPFIPGLPVTFTVLNSADNVLQLNTNLNVQFESTVWLCPETKVWKGEDFENTDEYAYISTGGEIGGPNSWFRVLKFVDDYKLVFCKDGTTCHYVGTYNDGFGVQRLVVGHEILAVKFQKVSGTSVEAEKMMPRMFPAY
ncbi:PREDICTED: bark lectin-like [Tarenaya hassleriana]|uniref:bark lectin-like n=1 Tax=Tarenaya hassleriana TaxID=28532 RepID=UPI00053C778B|nr:PREDICTED: bark lectin-like [Tarenaya hassleriana]